MFKITVDTSGLDDVFDQIAQQIRSALEPVARDYAGKPIDEVRPAVAAALAGAGVSGEDAVEQVTASISAGEDVRINLS
ncbi:hypothetical protein [Umezawaea tangerina]|uniref:Uncharacterized protein n=1 Tax=Umezawaea tangerina TaxID=84725 RepID=A0A2T0TCD4_9PSEU|nr:hypothetical protein [Umezawaea tangerina]PRY43315.1 hypothetical protein CLV43_10355 [Umezawaea tangerina]